MDAKPLLSIHIESWLMPDTENGKIRLSQGRTSARSRPC